MEIKEQKIEFWSCNCPVDENLLCKHLSAVLFQIRDRRLTNRAFEVDGLSSTAEVPTELNSSETQYERCQRLLASGDWEQAKRKALTGFNDNPDSQQWIKLLLRIAQKQENPQDILTWSSEMFPLSGYDLSYFDLIHKHSEASSWPQQVNVWLARIRSDDNGRLKKYSGQIGEILAANARWEELRSHLFENRGNLEFIEKHRAALAPQYPREMLDLSAHALMIFASYASGRREYKKIADSLYRLRDLEGGQQRSYELIAFFKKEYSKRLLMQSAIQARFSKD